jgi:hypothetical protein
VIVDFDDYSQGNHRLDLLHRLKKANPDFRCTIFAVPGQGTPQFWDATPDWCELAVHGWMHPTPRECEDWTAVQMRTLMAAKPARFVEGFKAPGWQISQGCYEALLDGGWWVADHPETTDRRPEGLRVHVLGDGDHWHGHIQNVCGNGLEETWVEVLARVTAAESFELISEVVAPWKAPVLA